MPQIVYDDPDGVHAMLRDSVASLAERRPGSASLRSKRSEAMDTDLELWSEMAQAGWVGLLLPEQVGGTGLGLQEQTVLSEALGRALISEPMATNAVMASSLLGAAPVSEERNRLARGLADGSAIIAVAWQDARGQVDDRTAFAASQEQGLVLTGRKGYVEQASSAADFLVVAEMDGGAALLSVPASTSGISIDDAASVDGARIAAVRFDRCKVPASSVLMRAPEAAVLLDQPILNARLALAAELAGVASRAVEISIDYTKTRIQFGKPIASFQVIQHRLVEMWSDAEFACASVVNAIDRIETETATSGRMAVLAAKARAGDAAVSICRRAVHLHGAMGFTDESDIGLYLKRAVSLNATLGQPEALRLEFVNLERAA
jgi:alkylation response protein AidB-like acyl-CoA dehydrogenase